MTCLPGASHHGEHVLTWCSEAGHSQESPPLFLLNKHTHTPLVVHYSHLRTFQYCGVVYYLLYILWGLDTKQRHIAFSCCFPLNPYLSTSPAFITERGRGDTGKNEMSFHLSKTIMLPIRRDIFIFTGKRCATGLSRLLCTDGEKQSTVRCPLPLTLPSHPFSLGVTRCGRHFFHWTSTHNSFPNTRGRRHISSGQKKEKRGRRQEIEWLHGRLFGEK